MIVVLEERLPLDGDAFVNAGGKVVVIGVSEAGVVGGKDKDATRCEEGVDRTHEWRDVGDIHDRHIGYGVGEGRGAAEREEGLLVGGIANEE